jgi:hypothetical protein
MIPEVMENLQDWANRVNTSIRQCAEAWGISYPTLLRIAKKGGSASGAIADKIRYMTGGQVTVPVLAGTQPPPPPPPAPPAVIRPTRGQPASVGTEPRKNSRDRKATQSATVATTQPPGVPERGRPGPRPRLPPPPPPQVATASTGRGRASAHEAVSANGKG